MVGSTNPTPVVIGLVAVNVVVFVLSGFGKASVIDRFGGLSHQVHQSDQYYRFFTSMFLHADVLHIASNMITLLIVGPAVEVMLGRARFLSLYLVAGLGGSVASYLFTPGAGVSAGASGAIFGVMGAYVVLAHKRRYPWHRWSRSSSSTWSSGSPATSTGGTTSGGWSSGPCWRWPTTTAPICARPPVASGSPSA